MNPHHGTDCGIPSQKHQLVSDVDDLYVVVVRNTTLSSVGDQRERLLGLADFSRAALFALSKFLLLFYSFIILTFMNTRLNLLVIKAQHFPALLLHNASL